MKKKFKCKGWCSGLRKCCLMVKFFMLFMLLSVIQLYAGVKAQEMRLDLQKTDVSLIDVLKMIERQSDYTCLYSYEDVAKVQNLDLNFKKVSIETILKKCLEGTSLQFKIVDKTIIIQNVVYKVQQEEGKTIRGKVTDGNGEVLPGVTILLKGTTTGTVSDTAGGFKLTIPFKGEVQLVFSFIGMKTQELKITDPNKYIHVVLESSNEEVDEVVVTGYFKRKKDSYTGVATSFTGAELRKVSGQNVLTALSMIDPSFQLVENLEMGSDPNTVPAFQIRGPGNLESEYKNNPNTPTFLLDGFEVSVEKIFDIDPNRIANITVLKDAAATAIYGSRAANGVVVIETIQPKEGELSIMYSLGLDFEVADLKDYNLMNAREKLEYEDKAELFHGDYLSGNDNYRDEYNAKLALIESGVDTDWLSIPTQDVGFAHKHTLFIEGGSSKFRYGFDLNYSAKEGVMQKSGRDKVGIGVKFQYNSRKLKFMNYLTYDQVNEYNSPYGNFSQYTYANPYFYPYDEKGDALKVMKGIEGIGAPLAEPNPVYDSKLGTKDEGMYKNFVNNFSVEWNVSNGLSLKGQFSISDKDYESDVFLPAGHTSFNEKTIKGSYTKGMKNSVEYDANVVLSYFQLFDKHAVNLGVVYNVRQVKTDGFTTTAYNYPNSQMDHIGMGMQYAEGDRPVGDYELSRLMGGVINLNYSYDNRYLFDVSVRSDASSVFGADKRWGTFGSLGIGWNIHNENFFKESNVLQVLKLRASWGITGGTNFYPFQAMTIYSYNDNSIKGITYDDHLGVLLKGFGNNNLKWQRTEKRNVGVDFELVNRRITGYFNYYSDLSKDVLIDLTLAPSVGFSSYKENLGKVKNTGIELNLKGRIIDNHKLGMRWDVFLNLVHNKNELMEINDALLAYNENQDKNTIENGNKKPVVRYQEGLSVNTLWVNESLGIDPSTGNEIFLDMENNKVSKWEVANYKPMGCTDPDVRGNFGTMFYYKNFSLSAYFSYSYGGQIYNQTLVDKVENVDPEKNADKRVLYDRWQEPGDISFFKSIKDKSRTMPTSRFIEDNNYVTLSSLNLSYEFAPFSIKKLKVDRLKLSLIGNDLIRCSTVKMERGLTYPFARTFTFSMQVTF